MVSQNFRREAFARETGEVLIALITITADNLTQPIYVASDAYEMLPVAGVYGVVSRGQEYIYLPFSMETPRDDSTGLVNAKIQITNVSRDIIAAVRTAQRGIRMKFEMVISSDVDYVEDSFDGLELVDVSYNALMIEGNLNVDYFSREPFQSASYTPGNTPGLF